MSLNIGITTRYSRDEGNVGKCFYIDNIAVSLSEKYGFNLVPVIPGSSFNDIDGLIVPNIPYAISEFYYADNLQIPIPAFNDYEIDMYAINEACAKQIPVLGICNGILSINVFMNGTLKLKTGRREKMAHPISINKGVLTESPIEDMTYLMDLNKPVRAHSELLQNIDNLGVGLKPLCMSRNNEIEGIISENTDILGVSWNIGDVLLSNSASPRVASISYLLLSYFLFRSSLYSGKTSYITENPFLILHSPGSPSDQQ